MAPKLAYLEQELNMTRAALRDHVLRIPAILAYSLDKRYRPRVEACRAAGVDAAYVLTAAPLTDEYFYERLETMREDVVATASSRATTPRATGVQHRVLRRRQRPPGHGARRAAPRHRLHVHGLRHAVGQKVLGARLPARRRRRALPGLRERPPHRGQPRVLRGRLDARGYVKGARR